MNEHQHDPVKTSKTVRRPPTVSFDIPTTPESSSQQLNSASSYSDLNYLFNAQEQTTLAPKPANRNRRKSNQDPHHTKHRRTRSGCYTCRSRRVKCDESHPVCERCKKGSRDCIYPESSSTSKSSGITSSKNVPIASPDAAGSSSDEDGGEGVSDLPQSMHDDEEAIDDVDQPASPLKLASVKHTHDYQLTSEQKPNTRCGSETPSLVQDKGASPTPSTEGSIGYSAYQTMGNAETNSSRAPASGAEVSKTDLSHLPPDLQFYLAYFLENVTYLHYSLKFDSDDVLHTQFINASLRNDSLLYAIVGFSAFQRTLHNPAGKIEDFLPYYNKSVSLLLRSLKKGVQHDMYTVLAILQLATIEEFLGDWVNLLGHQKAAYELLTAIYTPQTVMHTPLTRLMIGWYMRFDIFASLLGGFQTVLSREWFSYCHEYFQHQIFREPANLNLKIEAALAQSRLIATDMSLLYANMGKGEISFEQFNVENEIIGKRIQEWRSKMDPALQDDRFLIRDFSSCRPLDPDDIVDPYQPNTIFHGPLWAMNIAIIDWISIDMMHQYQTSLVTKTHPSAELGLKAFASCQLYEAMEFWSGSPPGIVLAAQASLGIACLFLPRDERHAMWARRKLAGVESNGYIYPYTFRTKMSDLFRDRSCMHWWLPNDEDYPPIVRSIRRFVEERTSPAKDLPSEDLRDMKAIFASLQLDDGKSGMSQNTMERKGSSTRQEPSIISDSVRDMSDVGIGESGGFGLGFDSVHDSEGYDISGPDSYP